MKKVKSVNKKVNEPLTAKIFSFPNNSHQKTRSKLRALEDEILIDNRRFPLFIPYNSISALMFMNSYEYGVESNKFEKDSFNRILDRSLNFMEYLIDIERKDLVEEFNPELYSSKNKIISHDITDQRYLKTLILKNQSNLILSQIPSVAINLQINDFSNMLNGQSYLDKYKNKKVAYAQTSFKRDFYLKQILREVCIKGRNIQFERPEFKKFKVKLS